MDRLPGAKMTNITILFFASLRDITGVRKMNKTIPDDLLISGLKKMLADEYPGLKEIMASVIVSLDHEFAFDNSSIPADAEIALFPPVSGG
jgi:molybdopterin converting factor subunit 1